MSDELNQEQVQRIADALASGMKIEAIKIYREATGKGLKEAKDFIEALIPELIEKDPEKYAKLAVSERAGCASALLFCIVVIVAGCRYIVNLL